jgi:hypothetical protein
MCNNTWYIHVQCTLLFIFAVCTAWCVYLQCTLAVICWKVWYSVNNTIYLYLVSININCTSNVDVTHCVLSLICVFCFVTMYVVFCTYLFLCFSIFCFVILLFLFFQVRHKWKKNLSTHSQHGEDEDPMVWMVNYILV